VAQAAVFGIRDPLYGERIAAVVVARKGLHLDPAELIAYSRDRLAPFEIPERITLADKLPLTAKGAIDRSELAQGRPTVIASGSPYCPDYATKAPVRRGYGAAEPS